MPTLSERSLEFQRQASDPPRLDHFLVACLPEYSRSRLQGLIKDGRVWVNGVPARKAGQILESAARVSVHIPPNEPSALKPEPIPLDIIYEDQDVLIINKAAGMVVHPAAGHAQGTLVHAALAHAPEMEGIHGEVRPGVVHRLDKNTSGLILLAKNDAAHRWLQEQFRSRKVSKVYLALVDGRPPTPKGRVEAPIGRSAADRKQMAVVTGAKGRAAISEYFTLESFPAHTFIEVHPITGRTHQIRLHMQFLGCPVVGDTVYGRRTPTIAIQRHFLHAARITLALSPGAAARTFSAPLPSELEAVLNQLRHAAQTGLTR